MLTLNHILNISDTLKTHILYIVSLTHRKMLPSYPFISHHQYNQLYPSMKVALII